MEESREEWSVHEWLEKAGMSEYIESFVDNGYDTPDLCAELQNDDLTAIGVKDKKHRSIIFSKARELLKLLSAAEVTDGPVNTPAEPIVVVKQLDTSSPTLPANGTGSYTEPWPSYTEPWAANNSNGVPIKLKKTGSDDKPPLPPPNKTKKKHPPPSPLPKDLPAFKRPEGGEPGLTKLQLQLKIREELRGEGILLSEAPYVDEEEQMCSQPLSDLAERYSQKLKLQPLDVYDALRVVWNSENSCNVTPLTPASAVDKGHPLTVILKGNSTENYDEPFDAADTAGVTPDCLKPQPSPKGGSKSHTLPPPSNGSTGNYDEPFDAVNKQQPSSPQQHRQQLESSPERRRIEAQSKTLPSSPKLISKTAAEDKHDDKKKSKHSSADGDASPKHGPSTLAKLFRRRDKGRSHSIQEFDMKQREEKKSGKKGAKISFPMRSKDTLSVGKAQKKKNGSSPRHSKHVCVESSSETDEGSSPQPTKKHGGIKFKKFITPPTLRRDECPLSGSSSSSDDSTPETVRKLRAIRSRGLTGSDLEISFRDDGATEKPWMVMSRSFDNLNDINRKPAAPSMADDASEKKKEGGGNIFSRIFKIRTLQSPSRKKTANKEKPKKKGASTNRSSLGAGYEGLAPPDGGQSSLANSLSMPDIAAVTPDKKKKNRKPFISSSHTPTEHLSDAEATAPTVATSPQHLATPKDTHTNIPVPKPRTLSRTQSPNNDMGMGAFGGSAPIKPSYLSSENRPIPEPRPRSKTPTSAEGSKNQSPNTSGSDIAMLDSSRSDSLSSQKSLGVPKKPAPPPKPAKIAVLDDKSIEASYKFSTLPYIRGVGATAVKEGGSPPRPIKQFSVPNGDSGQAALSQSVPSRILRESEPKKVPPKPVRNFAIKGDLQQEADTSTPLSSSAGARRPGGGGGGGDTGETSLPTSGSSVGQTAASSSSPPTPRQRPPPKPARSIKRKPQRERANAVVNRGGEEQTSPPKEVERPVSGGTTPPRSNSDSSSDKMVVGGGGDGETAPTSSGPPKPIRRIKTPKVVDSSSPQMEEEKERNNGTFGGRDQSSSSGCGTGNGNETSVKHAVRTINVSTPSPTSSSPTTPNDSSSFAEAAAFPHNTSATTAEVTKSTQSRFEAGGCSNTITPLSSTVASRSGSAGAGSKPQPKPKPRSLQQLGSQGSFSGGSGLGNGSGGGGTPRRPVPPNKPSRSSVRVATPEHRTT